MSFFGLMLLLGPSRLLSQPLWEPLREALVNQLSCLELDLYGLDDQRPLIEQREFCLASIYKELGYRPLWVGAAGPLETASVILQKLRTSFREGLNPEDYEVEAIESLWQTRRPEPLASLELLLTYNLAKYIHDVSFGQLKLRHADPELFAAAGNTRFDPVQAVRLAQGVADLGSYLESLPPQHHYYANLKDALERYRTLALSAHWPTIPGGPLLRPGDSDNRLAAIAQRLAVTPPQESAGHPITDQYHEPLVSAVIDFQKQHGLAPDGVVGPQTLAMLNRTPAELAAIIRANMTRWRWQDHDLSDTYLMVNIAAYRLKAVQEGRLVHDLPVIVGKFQHQTPVFSDSIRYLEFNPFWNVTPSIARNEELPSLQKNPRHLVERRIRLFSSWDADAHELDSTAIDWAGVSRAQMSRYLLRQDPGPWNALGRVKFVFPNHHSVYLHDTPSRDLFNQTSRSFSHGCIRVSQPLQLALFCLKQNNEGWTMQDIETIVSSGRRKIISLRDRLPIHITYQTAWVDNNGLIRFNADIYKRDEKLLQLLAARP